MIEDVRIKTHLIVTDVHEEYAIKWHGRIIDTKPELKNGKPIFIVMTSERRVELNTLDMKQIEDCAKRLTRPRGRAAITADQALIFIREVDGTETNIGSVTHTHVKKYAPMYDKVGYMGRQTVEGSWRDCKSRALMPGWFDPNPAHHKQKEKGFNE